MRLPRTGTKVWDRYLKAYEILYDSVTLFTEDGGCTFNFLPWEEDTSFKSVDCETSVILPDCEAHLHLLHLEQTFEPYWQHRELESTIHSFHFDDKAAEHKFSDGEATIFRGMTTRTMIFGCYVVLLFHV